MNLDELRSAQAKERRKDSLQHLRDAFYDDVAAYVADLRAARDRRAEQVANPFSDDDVRRMSDEIETAEEVAEALYERRVGKVVKLASFAAADMSVETEGLTTEERALFDDLVARIRTNKSTVLAALAGEEPPTSPDGPPPASAADGPDEEATGADTPATRDGEAGSRAPDGPSNASPVDDPPVDASPVDGPTDPDSNVLAGAMGGESSESPSRKPPESGASEDSAGPTDREETTDRTPTGRPESATADGGATPVEPGPAPPGAGDAGDTPLADGPSADDSSVDAPASPPTDAPAESDAAAGRSAAASETSRDGATGVDRETVRITRDVGSILGVDEREYDLASDDVVTLPTENAEPLVRRDAAERIE
jgi:DNA replication factor GINS